MNPIVQSAYKWLLLAYIAILPIAETIALRYLFLLLLLIILGFWLVRVGLTQYGVIQLLKWIPIPLLLWTAYLVLFPLWVPEPDVAFFNLKGQWGISIASWAVGLFGVLILKDRGPSLWQLGIASAFVVGVHLLMTSFAWSGLFGGNVTSGLPVEAMWSNIVHVVTGEQAWRWQTFPWGFRGFDPMHANLGYSASQAIAVFLACLAAALVTHQTALFWKSAVLIAVCFLSVIVANSRAAVLFSVLLVLLCAITIFVIRRRAHQIFTFKLSLTTAIHLLLLLLVVGSLAFSFATGIRKDSRWLTMADKAYVGFLIEDPIDFLCNGLTTEARTSLHDKISTNNPSYSAQILDGLNGDGGRVVLMRAGTQLIKEFPFGLDGSRHSFEKLMVIKCGHQPGISFAHTHQAWLDMSLALGWVGVTIWAIVLCYLVWIGWRGITYFEGGEWAQALFLLSLFCFLRAFTDSVYREHYLEMQAVLMGYIFSKMRLNRAYSLP